MNHPVLTAALCMGAFACAPSTSVEPDRTVVINYSRVPTLADSAAVRNVGAHRALVIPIASAIVVRGPADDRYASLPGVLTWQDRGPGEDPEVSAWISVVDDAPTSEDTAFVVSLGASLVITTDSRNDVGAIVYVVGAAMRLSLVPRLAERARFTKVRLGPDDDRPAR